jgi:cytoskeletal protein RodZ
MHFIMKKSLLLVIALLSPTVFAATNPASQNPDEQVIKSTQVSQGNQVTSAGKASQSATSAKTVNATKVSKESKTALLSKKQQCEKKYKKAELNLEKVVNGKVPSKAAAKESAQKRLTASQSAAKKENYCTAYQLIETKAK